MRILLSILALLYSLSATAVTFEELVDSLDEPLPEIIDTGVVRSIDLAARSIEISGFSYLVGPATIDFPVEVQLYGTTAGSFELLQVGMKVEVEYIDFGNARIALAIRQLSDAAEEVEF